MSARKDFAALVEKEIRFQNFLIREARGEINKRLVRVAALESVYKFYTSPNAGEGLHNRPDTFPQKHEIKIDWDKVAKENVAVTWAFEHDPKFADASIGIDATPAPAINDPVPTETAAGVAPAMEEDEAAVPPPSPAASSTITIDEAEIGSENTKGSTTKPRIGECAAGGDVAPALGNQSEPAVASGLTGENPSVVLFDEHEPAQIEFDKTIETAAQALGESERRLQMFYDNKSAEPTLEAIHQQGLKELDAIEAAPANPAPAADVESLEPEQPVRKSVKREVAKPARAAAAPVAAGDKVKVETIGSGVTRVSQGVVTIDFGRLMVICHRGQFRGSLANLQALEKLNDGGLYSFETIQRAAGYATVDRLMQDIPTIRDKLGDAGITLTATKGIGCRMWRAEK